MKAILLTSSALLLVSGLSAAQAQDAEACPAEIDAFTRDYEEAMAAFGSDQALSASEQAELFGLRTTAETQHRAGNTEMCLEAIARARVMLDTAIAPTAIEPRELVGMEIRNAEDKYLGEVDGVTLDPMSGRIAYLLVEHGGFLGIGDNLTPVPWRAVTWTPGAESLLLNMDEERLENAPQYLEEEVTPQQRRGWLLAVHSYFGVEPYWQDNFPSIAMPPATAGLAPGAETGATTEPTAGAAEPGTAASTSEAGAGSQPSGEGGDSTVVVVEPESTEGQAASGADASASGDATAAADQSSTTESAATPEAGSDSGTDAVMARIDRLESRIEEFSQQGAGEEVRQAIGDLEARVQELAQQDPGEEVQTAISELQTRVQSLAEQVPGEEIRSAMADLQARVQELAETAPGQELREMMARMESEIRQLAGSGAAGGAAANFATGSAGGDASGTATAGGTTQAGESRVIVIRPEDVQIVEPGQAGAGDSAGTAASTGQEADTGAATAAGQAGQDTTAAAGAASASAAGGEAQQSGGEQAAPAAAQAGSAEPTVMASPSATSGSGAGEAQDSSGGQAASAAPQGEAAPSALATPSAEPGAAVGETAAIDQDQPAAGQGGPAEQASPAEADDEGQAAMTAPEGIEPCATAIAQLEEDLTRAEEAGLSIVDARNELEAAQAMLNRDSQALCRAAIKRAQDKLVAQGFKPAEAN